jgi:succinate-semialdehyde dehydrogenase/glutarate-semialdehyde dehydrogenase
VSELVTDAIGRGAAALAGAMPRNGRGHFYEPTVLTEVAPDARLLHEEIFGPVAPIVPVADDDEAIARANDTEYGLVAYVYTENVRRAIRTSERLDTGMVGLNRGLVSNAGAPFGGTKQSGLGREGGDLGIEEFLETKYVALDA